MIDDLESGGAQRQLVAIAVGLRRRGYEVEVFTYYPGAHFKVELDRAGITVHQYNKNSRFSIGPLIALGRVLRSGKFDGVLAFLATPVLYTEIVGMIGRDWRLVVGERSANPILLSGGQKWLRWMHRFADSVVTNSHSNRQLLEHAWPGLRSKLSTIYNAVDLNRFSPGTSSRTGTARTPLRMVVAASYQRNKNMLGLATALAELRKRGGAGLIVDWYGAVPQDPMPLNEARDFSAQHDLNEVLRFHPPTPNIEQEFRNSDVVGLFSGYEGLPNVVCEAMACGRPVIMSDVSDARHLVQDGETGLLCDPNDPSSIAGALERFIRIPPEVREKMGRMARERAELMFAPNAILDQYEREIFPMNEVVTGDALDSNAATVAWDHPRHGG